MTQRKFFRLFLVLFIPLMLAGIAFVESTANDDHAYIYCHPIGSSDWCRTARSPDSAVAESAKRNSDAWFDVNLPDDELTKLFYTFVAASTRSQPALIQTVVPTGVPSPEGRAFMQSLEGRIATVVFGIKRGEHSGINNGELVLACNNLNFQVDRDKYVAQCFGSSWSGSFTMHIDGGDQALMQTLRQAIKDEVAKQKSDYIMQRVILYPIFVYLFLILAALSWLCVKAYRFVRAG